MFALIDGEIVPLESAHVPIWDLGFAQGVSVTEQLRTLGQKPWLVEAHLERLEDGLRQAWLEWPDCLGAQPKVRLLEWLERLIARSVEELDREDDLGVCLVITGGDHVRFRGRNARPLSGTRLVGHAFPLPHAELARRHAEGVRLVTVPTREIPGACLDRRLKSRSRMHYWIAQRQAEFTLAGSQALLLDLAGHVAESPAATIVAVDGPRRSCLVPEAAEILPGTCLGWFLGLAERFGLEVSRRPLQLEELKAATEVLSFSTPGVVAAVVEVDGAQIGMRQPGEIYWRLLEEIAETTGVDLVRQAQRFAAV